MFRALANGIAKSWDIFSRFYVPVAFVVVGIVGTSTLQADMLVFGSKEERVCSFLIEGEISQETASNFQKEMMAKRNPLSCELSASGQEANSFIRDVVLQNSPGGDVAAAYSIMQTIRNFELNTHIDTAFSGINSCQSACALIFASGKQRHLTDRLSRFEGFNSQLGIHKPDFIEGTYDFLQQERELDKLKYELIDFLSSGGVDPRFTISMFETPAASMFFPTLQDLLIWRVVTSIDLPASHKRLSAEANLPAPCTQVSNREQARKDLARLLEVYPDVMKSGSEQNRIKLPKAIEGALACIGVNGTP